MREKTTIELVREFHQAFGQQFDLDPVTPEMDSRERAWLEYAERVLRELAAELKARAQGSVPLLRMQLMTEELGEFAEAMLAGDVVEMLDALTDSQYVLDGTYLAVGLDDLKDAAFLEVHRSNMAKLDASGRQIIGPSGRVQKPDGWQPPDLRGVFSSYILKRT